MSNKKKTAVKPKEVELRPMKEKAVVTRIPVTKTEDRIGVNTAKKIKRDELDYYTKLLRKKKEFQDLTNKETEFVVNYILYNGNSIRALEATYPEGTAGLATKAKHLMAKREITDAINVFWKTMYADKIQRIEKGILDVFYRRAFSNPFKYFKLDGTLREGVTAEDIGDDYVIIDSVEKKIYTNNKTGEMREVVVYKFADRDKAFDKLQKLLGLDVTKIKVIGAEEKEQSTGVLRIPEEVEEAEWETLNTTDMKQIGEI